MRPLFYLLLTLFFYSGALIAQNPGVRVYPSLNNWQLKPYVNNQNFHDPRATSGVHTYMNQYFDFGTGIQVSFPGGEHQWLAGLGYEVNSIHTVASHFYDDGELRRRFKLHFAMAQLGYLRKLQLGNYSFEAGGGLSALVNIHTGKSIKNSKLTYIPPAVLGVEDFRYERFSVARADQLTKPMRILPAVYLESRFPLGVNHTGAFFLFANTSLTLNPALTYTWFYRDQRFAFHQANRFSSALGIQYIFNRK